MYGMNIPVDDLKDGKADADGEERELCSRGYFPK
jgi:hypothetical protein